MRTKLASVFFFVLLTGAGVWAQPGIVQCQVVDSVTGDRIEGAVGTIAGGSATPVSDTTAADGLLEFAWEGGFDLEVVATGYESAKYSGTVAPSATVRVRFLLVRAPVKTGTIAGTVTDSETVAPIEGAQVVLRSRDTSIPKDQFSPVDTFVTGPTGVYQFDDLPASPPLEYEMYVLALYYTTGLSGGFDLPADDTVVVDFELVRAPKGAIEGTVTDSGTGAAIPSATVVVVTQALDTMGTTTTNAAGYYVVGGLPASVAYGVIVEKDTYQDGIAEAVVVMPDDTTVADIAMLSNTTSITGIVSAAADSSRVQGAVVRLIDLEDTVCVDSAVTAADGAYEFSMFSPGTYRVVAEAADFYPDSSADTSIDGGGSAVFDFVLSARGAGNLHVFVGEWQPSLPYPPLEGAMVYAVRQGAGSGDTLKAATDSSGWVDFTDAKAGAYILRAYLAGHGPDSLRFRLYEEEDDTASLALRVYSGKTKTFTGMVYDNSTAEPVAGAEMSLTVGYVTYELVTPDSGDYVFTFPAADTTGLLLVVADGYQRVMGYITLTADTTVYNIGLVVPTGVVAPSSALPTPADIAVRDGCLHVTTPCAATVSLYALNGAHFSSWQVGPGSSILQIPSARTRARGTVICRMVGGGEAVEMKVLLR